MVQDDADPSTNTPSTTIAGMNATLPGGTTSGNGTGAVGVSAPTLVGDPIELAAMKSVGWRWDADSSTAFPGRAVMQSYNYTIIQHIMCDITVTLYCNS